MKTITTKTPSDTQQIASQLNLAAGQVIALVGPLGAGKTTLVQGVAKHLGINDYVVSPTFTIANEYLQGITPLYHIDLYRLSSQQEAVEAGLMDYLPSSSGVTIVEWANQISSIMPPKFTLINLDVCGEFSRSIAIEENASPGDVQ